MTLVVTVTPMVLLTRSDSVVAASERVGFRPPGAAFHVDGQLVHPVLPGQVQLEVPSGAFT